MNTKQRTTCEQLGWQPGDFFIASEDVSWKEIKAGDIVQLVHDDSSSVVLFSYGKGIGVYPVGLSHRLCDGNLEQFVHYVSVGDVEPVVLDDSTFEMYCMLYPSEETYLRGQYGRQKQGS